LTSSSVIAMRRIEACYGAFDRYDPLVVEKVGQLDRVGPMLSDIRRPRPGFGLSLPTSGPFATAANIYAIAGQAEAHGFDDVWVNDHYSYPRERHRSSAAGTFDAAGTEDPNFFESLVALAAVGARYRNIGVAVHALQAPLRDPRLMARQVAAIHELSGRGITIAPGIGGQRDEFAIAGVPFERRGRLLDEHLAVMDAIFNQEAPVSFEGKYVRFKDATFYPKPKTIQLWITGDSDPALARVVRYATGWFSGHAGLHDFPARAARLDELAVAAGRDPRGIERGGDLFVCVARTHDEAMRIGAESLRRRRGSLEKALARDAIGSAAEVAQLLGKRLRDGRTYLELRLLAASVPSCLEMIEQLAKEVFPDLRREFADAPAVTPVERQGRPTAVSPPG
jgi:alkanesulfonate monooxygenase SsuD/methylene tetrahydromethanopterin reductase-like flavin-dependent oxidoreductase (luciferase family)